MFSIANFSQKFSALTNCRDVYVAFSGGLDSQVLLHVLVSLQKQKNSLFQELSITAIHINHGLSKNAEKWTHACQAVCDSYAVKLLVCKVNARVSARSGLSQEEVARNLRYQEFAKIVSKDAVLVTAHHKDDQVETLFLQLMRGAGVKGLAAMPRCIKFHKGSLIRPLLDFTRSELESYAKKYKLKWIEDESNLSCAFDRNFVRHKVLPILKERWPSMLNTVSRSADHLASANVLLDELAMRDLARCRGKVAGTLSLVKLQGLSSKAQRNLVRFWLQKSGFTLPSSKKIDEIEKAVVQSRDDAAPLVKWRGVEIRRFASDIYALVPLQEFSVERVLKWDLIKPLKLPAGLGILRAKALQETLPKIDQEITVRFRRGGEKIKISGHKHSKSLKKLFQEFELPPWQRERVPLLYFGDELVAVVGFVVSDKAKDWCFVIDPVNKK